MAMKFNRKNFDKLLCKCRKLQDDNKRLKGVVTALQEVNERLRTENEELKEPVAKRDKLNSPVLKPYE